MAKGTESTDYQLFMDLWAFVQGEEREGVTPETI